MKALVLDKVTYGKDVVLSEIEKPTAKPGYVVVKVLAFGLNHSEKILRLNEINYDYIHKPIVPGIELVGEIEESMDDTFKKGEKVCSLMGGLGRSYNGSYEEYVLLPIRQVFKIPEMGLSDEKLAAILETYFTAYGSLRSLRLEKGETLLIRGATCALGYAAISLAIPMGVKVIATTHREEKLPLLDAYPVKKILDDGMLSKKITADKVLELVGVKTLRDSLLLTKENGIVCHTGILGGVYSLNGFDPIKEIPNNVYLTGFLSNYPTQEIMDEIFDFIKKNSIDPAIGHIFPFAKIKEALLLQDEGKTSGKIVVTMKGE